MIILEKPNFPPYVCIICNMSTGKKWFVSMDINLEQYFNPLNDGRVFYCNECWDNMVTDTTRAVQTFLIGHEAYVGEEPTFDNPAELIIGKVGESTAGPVGSTEVLFPELGDESGPGSSSTSVQDVSGPDADINSSSVGSDPQPSDNPAVSEFLEHFGTGNQDG
jgi:hypothetical protein